jgi:hypothetical protein
MLAQTLQNLFIQGGLALWVIYGFHRGSSNYLTVNVDERFGRIQVVGDISRCGGQIATIVN